ncbi:unnamed protein product [Pylaiella littoralis]
MVEDGGTGAAPLSPRQDEKKQKRAPKVSLKKPLTREDIPQLQSTVQLVNHEFSARQRECLVKDRAVGPLYEAMMEKCVKFGDKPRELAMCCSRQLCRKEQVQLIACIRATRDASLCHEFRDEVERCGVRMSQRMLRAALSDDWF